MWSWWFWYEQHCSIENELRENQNLWSFFVIHLCFYVNVIFLHFHGYKWKKYNQCKSYTGCVWPKKLFTNHRGAIFCILSCKCIFMICLRMLFFVCVMQSEAKRSSKLNDSKLAVGSLPHYRLKPSKYSAVRLRISKTPFM